MTCLACITGAGRASGHDGQQSGTGRLLHGALSPTAARSNSLRATLWPDDRLQAWRPAATGHSLYLQTFRRVGPYGMNLKVHGGRHNIMDDRLIHGQQGCCYWIPLTRNHVCVIRYRRICAISGSLCAVGRLLVGAIIDRSTDTNSVVSTDWQTDERLYCTIDWWRCTELR